MKDISLLWIKIQIIIFHDDNLLILTTLVIQLINFVCHKTSFCQRGFIIKLFSIDLDLGRLIVLGFATIKIEEPEFGAHLRPRVLLEVLFSVEVGVSRSHFHNRLN